MGKKRTKKKMSAAMREKLLKTKKSLESGGIYISNKDLTSMRVRLLPCGVDDAPGLPVHKFYVQARDFEGPEKNGKEQRSTLSPRTFGMRCPVHEALNTLYNGNKDDKKLAKGVNQSVEYWMAVIDRDEEGTVSEPNIRILQGKKTVYKQIINQMVDDDDYDDFTDVVDGRDIRIKKSGTGLDTEWSIKPYDSEPLHEDEAMAEAIIEANEAFNLKSKLNEVNWEVIEAIYEFLTGDEMPEWYAEQEPSDDDDSDDDDSDEEEAPKKKKKSKKSDDGAEHYAVGTRVSFEDGDGDTIKGEIKGMEDGEYLIDGDDDGEDEDPWGVAHEDLTVLPVKKKKKTAKRTVKKTTKATKEEPEEPKKKSLRSGGKPPRKPAGGASSKIANRNSKKKKKK